MLKKISIILLSIAILMAGGYGLKRLRYWERSVWVMKAGAPPARFDRGRGEFQGRAGQREGRPDGAGEKGTRPESSERPEGPRRQEEGFSRGADNGSLSGTERPGPERFEGRHDSRDSRDGHGFRSRKKVSMRNVVWFLAAFAFFTTAVIYLDKGVRHFILRKEKAGNK